MSFSGVEQVAVLREKLRQWRETGALATFLPEVWALRGVPQPPEFHPEGDAFEHTMLAVAAVGDDEDARVFWSVLLHDIGKLETTVHADGRWRSPGHAAAGAGMVPGIMRRLGHGASAADVAWLVKHHHYRQSWNLGPDGALTSRQRRFTCHPLFSLLQRVCLADAAGKVKPAT